MFINGTDKIDPEKGPYVVLVDYGSEGMSVSCQCETTEHAIAEIAKSCWSGPLTLLRLVDVSVAEVEDE